MLNRQTVKRVFSFGLILCVLAALFCVPASANSAPKVWFGFTHSGALLRGDACPIEVKQEKLTLSVPDQPKGYSKDPEFWKSYQSEMRAEYTFYNPTQETVAATLAFPCGPMPDYALERTGKLSPDELTAYYEKYGAYVNGEKIGTTARYSLAFGSEDFDIADLAELRDEPVVSGLLTPETPVTVSVYKVDGIQRLPTDYFTGAKLNVGGTTSRFVYLSNLDGERWCDFLGSSNGDCNIYRVENGDRILAVIFGDPPGEETAWEFVKSAEGYPPAAGEATLVSSESITFREFCEREKTVYPDASFTDLFNATVKMIKMGNLDYTLDLNYEKTGVAPVPVLMCWYEYDITLAPGETLTNTVRAPLYPKIYGDYNPPVCEYTYLLSPAKNWAKFGTLEISIETPFYLSEESLDGFKKTDGGYRLTRDGLPDGELTFSLCKTPFRIPGPRDLAFAAFMIAVPVGGIIGFIVLICVLFKAVKNSRKKKAQDP